MYIYWHIWHFLTISQMFLFQASGEDAQYLNEIINEIRPVLSLSFLGKAKNMTALSCRRCCNMRFRKHDEKWRHPWMPVASHGITWPGLHPNGYNASALLSSLVISCNLLVTWWVRRLRRIIWSAHCSGSLSQDWDMKLGLARFCLAFLQCVLWRSVTRGQKLRQRSVTGCGTLTIWGDGDPRRREPWHPL